MVQVLLQNVYESNELNAMDTFKVSMLQAYTYPYACNIDTLKSMVLVYARN